MKSVSSQHRDRSALPRRSPARALRSSQSARGLVLRSSQSEAGRGLRSATREGGLARRSFSEGGFTLVELIAVIAIIAILSAAVLGGVVYAGKKASVAATKGLIERLSVAINMYREDYGAYPPDRNPNHPSTGGWEDDWYTDPGNNLNMPAETLWYFLAGIYEDEDLADTDREKMARKSAYINFREKDLRRVGILFWMKSGLLMNLGDSHASKDVGGQIKDNDIFPEIVDVWGMPIHYVAKGSFSGDTPRVNEDSFDLVSRGPDRLATKPYDMRDVEERDKYPNRDNIGNW